MLEIIIFLLSICQSIFGVGLLVIGTPLLLLLDYNFLSVLKTLLPCSILISIFQITNSKPVIKSEKKVIYYALPYVFIGILILYLLNSMINFKLIVGFAILLSFYLKFFLKKRLSFFINKNKVAALCFAGLFHGLTNTGGSLISLIFQELKNSKVKIKISIAYTYFYFALIQYTSLNFFEGRVLFDYENLKLLLLSTIGYFVGIKIFKELRFKSYVNSLNFIVFFSSIYLIFSELK
tara:strand:+ start:151 stop:858 length:708 start_codon:yes stop_codon:yes gene_type:complete